MSKPILRQKDKEECKEEVRNTFFKHFGKLKDPRVPDNQCHRFTDILFIILCAIVAGCDNVLSIVNYAQTKKDWLIEILNLRNDIPSYSTFWWVLVLMDPEPFEKAFINWMKERYGKLEKDLHHIAIDGKTSRGTRKKHKKALHMLSAWSSYHGLIIGQQKTDDKSNEIKAIPELLKEIEIKNAVITIDAMGCQKEIAKQIRNSGGDYIFALKGNQENLNDHVRSIFEADESETKNIDIKKRRFSCATSYEKGHGRIEKRMVRTTSDLERVIPNAWRNAGIKSVIEVTSEVTDSYGESRESRYYISSLSEKAEVIGQFIRKHWAVESFHWILEISFRDDAFQSNTGHAAENISLFKRLTLNLIKMDTSNKLGVVQRRRRAGWDDRYLLKILENVKSF